MDNLKGAGVRALARLERSGNIKKTKRYWTKEEDRSCRFCKKDIIQNIILRNVRKSVDGLTRQARTKRKNQRKSEKICNNDLEKEKKRGRF